MMVGKPSGTGSLGTTVGCEEPYSSTGDKEMRPLATGALGPRASGGGHRASQRRLRSCGESLGPFRPF